MEPAMIEEGRPNRDNNALEGETTGEGSNTASLFIVVLSLLFVAIFGYALIGGVISGDPTNGFFITIIVASTLAIVVSGGVLVRYIIAKRTRDNDSDQYLSKDNRGTFSGSDLENQQVEENVAQDAEDETLMEIHPKSVFGEMSALSPSSYGEDSLTTYHHHIIRNQRKNGFDFSRITEGQEAERVRPRQDPPEGVGAANFQAAWVTRGNSQDPDGPKMSTEDAPDSNDDTSIAVETASRHGDEEKSVKTPKSPMARLTSVLRPKSPANSVAASLPPVSILKKKGKTTVAPKRPSTTKSVPTFKSFPNTPAASEAGSIASSFFGMFGKNKKAASEVGVPTELSVKQPSSDVSVKSGDAAEPNAKKPPMKKPVGGKPPMVRPPMLPPSNKMEEKMVKTIAGRSMPSTPSEKSTFTIPPPRPIPRTPMGSVVMSEFQSEVGSTAASSTFDPVAHERALAKLRESEAAIGARPAMPVYYNDDEEDDDDDVGLNENEPSATQSIVEPSVLSYDVFAPPGALGIVVDTTEKGCIVYSLKKSSPMQGLMNKGDLIIGLDNFDVRNMDAASLTKLMAKKAQQAERKFTLMPTSS